MAKNALLLTNDSLKDQGLDRCPCSLGVALDNVGQAGGVSLVGPITAFCFCRSDENYFWGIQKLRERLHVPCSIAVSQVTTI